LSTSASPRKSFQSTDIAILFIAIVGFLLTFYVLFFDPSFFGLLGQSGGKNGIKIGKIAFAGETARKKIEGSFSWDYVKAGTPVLLGDSLFTGKSPQTRVLLQEKNSLDLGSNTLIRFIEIDGVHMPELKQGNINLKIEGSLKVAIQGQITEIKGSNAQVQLYIEKGKKPQVRLLEGEAKVFTEDKKIIPLAQGKAEQLQLAENIDRQLASEELPPEELSPNPSDQASSPPAPLELPTYYKLYDVYDLDGTELRPKAALNPALSFLPQAPPSITGSNEFIYLENSEAVWSGKLNQENLFSQFVVEISTSPTFEAQATRVDWNPKEEISLRFSRPQRLFLRARAANSKYELTLHSATVEIHIVEKRNLAIAPESIDEELKALAKQPQRSLKAKKNPVAKSEPAQAKPPQRKPAATPPPEEPKGPAGASSMLADPYLDYRGKNYNSSQVGFESSAYNMYSGTQTSSSVNLAQPILLGLSGRHWFGSTGVEAYYRSKVSSLNDQGASVSPTILDFRYHYRFGWGFNPFSSLNESQVSVFLGYELLRNQGTTLYRPSYDITKIGVQFYFPLLRNWDTGGTLAGGKGIDGTLKYEITGHLHYFFRPKWSWGLGYRIHLYQATQPGELAGVPYPGNYREGVGEGYSVIRWHY
jgi:hypothetical protein